MDAEWRKAGGELMTDAPIRAYGGLRIPGAALKHFARRVMAGEVELHAHHDNRVRMRDLEVYVVDSGDGATLCFVTDLHREDRHWLDESHSLSASLTMPLDRDAQRTRRDDAALSLSADHAWFSDAVLIEAEQRLLASGVSPAALRVERALQFSFLPEPLVSVEISLVLLEKIEARVLSETIDVLLAKRAEHVEHAGRRVPATVINIRLTDGARAMTAVVVAPDAAVAQCALASLDEAMALYLHGLDSSNASEAVVLWDAGSDAWRSSDGPFTSVRAAPRAT